MSELRLVDRQGIAAELGVTLTSAESVMRRLPKVKIGRRVFVRWTDLADYIRNEAKT